MLLIEPSPDMRRALTPPYRAVAPPTTPAPRAKPSSCHLTDTEGVGAYRASSAVTPWMGSLAAAGRGSLGTKKPLQRLPVCRGFLRAGPKGPESVQLRGWSGSMLLFLVGHG